MEENNLKIWSKKHFSLIYVTDPLLFTFLIIHRSPQWSLLYVANNSRIGCSYAKYEENSKPVYNVKCITNENDVKIVKEAYKEMAKGHCRKCNEWNEPCNVVHMGLCGKN